MTQGEAGGAEAVGSREYLAAVFSHRAAALTVEAARLSCGMPEYSDIAPMMMRRSTFYELI